MPTYEEKTKALVQLLVDQGKIDADLLKKIRDAQDEKRRKETEAKK